MDSILNFVATLILLGGGIGAVKYFMGGNVNKALITGLIAFFVASILFVDTRSAWMIVIKTVISFAGKILERFSGAV